MTLVDVVRDAASVVAWREGMADLVTCRMAGAAAASASPRARGSLGCVMASKNNEGGYEFSALENKRVARLAGAMQLVASLQVAGGVLGVVLAYPVVRDAWIASKPAAAIPVAAILVPLFVGMWTYRAGGHLRLIVRTEGADIEHLMAAFGELTKLYVLQLWLFFVLFVGVAVVVTARLLPTFMP